MGLDRRFDPAAQIRVVEPLKLLFILDPLDSMPSR